ncbi:MAG: ATP-binding protein [Actinomycetota bacterium]
MSRRRVLPLSFRIVGIYAMLVAATLLVVTGLALHLTRIHLAREVDQRLAAVANSFKRGPAKRAVGTAELVQEAKRWLEQQAFPRDQVAAVAPLAGGEVLQSSGGIDLREVPRAHELLVSKRQDWWDVEGPDGPIHALTVPILQRGRPVGTQVGTLVVAISRSTLESTIGTLFSGIAIASGIGLAFATLLALVAVRRTLLPLARISREVEAIQETGDLSRRVTGLGPADEVGRLGDAFDGMLERLEEAFLSQQRFLSDASHELRTPLTVIRGQLELLDREIRSLEARRSLAVAVEELDRMRRIVEDLLLLARLDEGMPLATEPVEVELAVEEALLRSMVLASREPKVKVESELYVTADPDRLLQVLTNLVSNAVRHGGDAPVGIEARGRNGQVEIEVSDAGPGISPEDLPHVFERLFRGSIARSRSPEGAGLGLAIAASLVRAMNGEITVSSTLGDGTTFTVALPRATSP